MPTPTPDPNAYLRIGSSTYGYYNLDTVVNADSIRATFGRQTTSEQPSPSVLSFTVTRAYDQTAYDFNINDVVEWGLKNGAGTGITRVFYGTVTDINMAVTYWQNGKGYVDYNIMAVGPLTRLQRYYVNSPLSKQYEGDRIFDICSLVGASTSLIETPGGYEVTGVTAAYGPGLGYAQTAAQSGLGLLYEDYDKIRYESYLTRSGRSTSFSLTGNKVEAVNLATTTTITNVVNRVSVAYGSSGGTLSTEYVDTNSQTLYGPLFGTRSTELHNVSDANTQAQQLLKARAYPYAEVTSMVINLENPNLTTTDKNNLLAVRTGQRCTLPLTTVMGTSIDAYIEGYSWELRNRQRILTLYISDHNQNVPYTVWYNVDAAATWNTYATATTTWSDIT